MKTRYLILMASVAMFAGNAFAGTDTTRCAQYCAQGATCDCDWDASTNTLTINNGDFEDWAFKFATYNINIEGDGISWGRSAFYSSEGAITYSGSNATFNDYAFTSSEGAITYSGSNATFNDYAFYFSDGAITYSGSGATFGNGAFEWSEGAITYCGSGATFGNDAFEWSDGAITYSGSNATFNDHAFAWAEGDIILSPESIAQMGKYSFSHARGNIYCTTAKAECDAALSALGVNKTTLNYSQYMEKNRVSASQYTTDEALTAITGAGNNKLTIYFK